MIPTDDELIKQIGHHTFKASLLQSGFSEKIAELKASEHWKDYEFEARAALAVIKPHLDAAEAREKRLREALKPFADAAETLDDNEKNHWKLWERPVAMDLTVKCLRNACAALEKTSR